MEAKNEVSVQNIQVVNLEDIFDLEELESREAPCVDAGLHGLGYMGCHNHNETLVRDEISLAEPLRIEMDVEELESREAPCTDAGVHGFVGCHNHNETLRRDI
jgi:hypothetical protein